MSGYQSAAAALANRIHALLVRFQRLSDKDLPALGPHPRDWRRDGIRPAIAAHVRMAGERRRAVDEFCKGWASAGRRVLGRGELAR